MPGVWAQGDRQQMPAHRFSQGFQYGQEGMGQVCNYKPDWASLSLSHTSLSFVRLLHGAWRSHCGARVTDLADVKKTKPKAAKTSALRRNQKFNSSDQSSALKIAYQLPTERSKDSRSLEERAGVISWVCEPCFLQRDFFLFCISLIFRPNAGTLQAASATFLLRNVLMGSSGSCKTWLQSRRHLLMYVPVQYFIGRLTKEIFINVIFSALF